MKYVSYIFEDQDVRNTASKNEYLVEVASNAVINHNALLDAYVYNNLERFTGNNLAEIYENIRSFIIQENLAIYSQYSEILSDNQLSDQEKVACVESDVVAAAEAVGKSGLKGVLHSIKGVMSNIETGLSHGREVKRSVELSPDEMHKGARDHRFYKTELKRNEQDVESIKGTKAFKFGSHLANHESKYAKVFDATAGVGTGGTVGVAGKYKEMKNDSN